MAIHFHSKMPIPWQTSLFNPPLPAAAQLLGRANSSLSPRFTVRHLAPLVQCAGSVKPESEVQSVKIPAKSEKLELPPLVASLTIPDLPPWRESIYAEEALAVIMERWPYQWIKFYCNTVNPSATLTHPSAVSCESLAAISSFAILMTVMDDILFDLQNDRLREKSGIDHTIVGNPHRIREYLHSLSVAFRQEEPLQNMTQIQEMAWQLGCDFRKLSTPEWFSLFADAMQEYFNSCLESHIADAEGDGKYVMDLELYTQMRIQNVGSPICSLTVELGNNVFLPTEIREHPLVIRLTMCTWAYIAYSNDIFSYSKEQDEPHSRNLIKVLMESEGMANPEAAWRAVSLTNSVVREFTELEKQLPVWEDESKGSIVHRYVQGLKEFMSGILYFHSSSKRYRHPQAVFPELRDLNISSTPEVSKWERHV